MFEDILQYLPLKDKLRLESVSKQFQRTVFVKQYSLTLEKEEYDSELNTNYLKSIETVLKKCPNIQRIDGIYQMNYEIRKNTIQLITKYCNHLIEFEERLLNTNECESQEFYRKFGQKLKYLGFTEHVYDFNLFPNIESIDEYNVVNEFRIEEVLQLNSVNNLKKLGIDIEVNKEHLLPQLMQKFQKLTHLTLELSTYALDKVFKDFPITQNLLELIITFHYYGDFEGMCDSLNQIAIKCPKLKRIVFYSIIVLRNSSDMKQLFQQLKAFPSLKRLDIFLGKWDETDLQSTHQWFSFELFKGFPQQLTHLSLGFEDFEESLNESVLKDIDIYLPKLQYLYINSKIITDKEGMTQMVDILSRLSRLQSIYLRLNYPISELIEAKIAEKCRKIRKCFIY